MKAGFPEASISFKRGLDILYSQFNDIDIYVEDAGKEYMYYQLFKFLLPGIKLAKIFSLGGKDNVVLEAQANSSNKNKVYLVDLDFDNILAKKQTIRNLIYLERYSIENYLVDEGAIKEQIREKKPSMTDAVIERLFIYKAEVSKIAEYLITPALAAILVQRYDLRIAYPSIEPYEYITYKSTKSYSATMSLFLTQVETALKAKDGRFTLAAKIRAEKYNTRGIRRVDVIPGKWILTLLKEVLRREHLVSQKSDESFAYALAKDIDKSNLRFIVREIERIRS